MKIKRLYLHDDSAQAIVTDDMISVRMADALGYARGQTIGEITKTAKGWLDAELEMELADATATVRSAIKRELLKLPSMSSWVGAEGMCKIAMASKTLYVILERPCEGKVSLKPADLSGWAPVINTSQDWFEIGEPWMTSGGYEGCTIQMNYTLLKNKHVAEI